jgi:tetratricopeptide (TPR) repeat protein
MGPGIFYEEGRKAGTEVQRLRLPSSLPALIINPLFLLWLLLASAQLASAVPEAEFEAANKLFEQGKFADAAGAYERLLTNGSTAALHFNLGNARFKSGQPGQAIFHFHQALRLAPRDPDARGNLQFARRSLGVTGEENLGRHLLRLHTLDEWAWLAGAGLGGWFLLLALGEALPAKRIAFAWVTKTFAVAALTSTVLLVTAHWERSAARLAVVVVPEAPTRPGPLAESKAAFALRDGTEIVVLDAKDDWLQVRDASQRTGWVKREAVWQLP